jgi:phosphate transport system protein
MKSHTDRQYESELTRVRDMLAAMGGTVEAMIDDAVQALVDHDVPRAQAVIARDAEVDRLEVEIDELCLQVLARRQPTASDLRFLAVAMKLVVDLERIGDIAVNLAERAVEVAAHAALKPYMDIPRMGRIAREMVSDALDAFVRRDAALARTVFARDNVVDALYAQILREILTYMIEDPHNIYRATRLLSVAKLLERIGDHATNVAEQAIFMIEGRDVRHTGLGKVPDGEVALAGGATGGVLFVCAGNAARSQIAEGWARRLAPQGTEVASAGLTPSQVHPLAVQVMAEVGIDIASARSKSLSDVPIDRFGTVVTLCDEAACVTVPGGASHLHWPMPDPVARQGEPESVDAFRRVRDELAARIERLFRMANREIESGSGGRDD